MGEQCESCKLVLQGGHECDKLEPLELKLEPTNLADNYEFKPTVDFEVSLLLKKIHPLY